jgi:hypothetical protein
MGIGAEEIRNPNVRMFKTGCHSEVTIRFGHSDFENLNLFRISIFEFRIYGFRIKLRPMQSFLGL